jgi:tetratricopeptide (TPR) repeat protein
VAGLVASLILVLAGGFAATTALWLRAERDRAEAEANFRRARAAVDDYLTRVAESRLLGVPGLQPLRRELLESALPYYESFVRQRTDDPALARELASAYGRVGRINAELGRGDGAIEGYEKALEILSRPAGASGTDGARLEAERARYQQAIGDVHLQAGDLAAAMRSYQAAEAILRPLTGTGAQTPGSPGNLPPAPGGPEDRDALAILLERIGTVHERAGELVRAAECYGEAARIEWAIVRGGKKPADAAGLDQHLARMFTKLGDLQVGLDMDPGALRHVVGDAVTFSSDFGVGAGERFPFHKRAEAILTRLIRESPVDPRVDDFRRDLADCREHYAGALVRIERDQESLAPYREALAIRQQLARGNPAVTSYQEDLARVEFEYGRLLERVGQRPDALERYRQAVEHQRLAVATSPGAVPLRRAMAMQLARLGDAERQASRPAQAMDDYRDAGEWLNGLEQPTGDDLYLSATLHAARAGLVGEGKARLSESERALVDRSAAAAIAALTRAIDAGFEAYDRAVKDRALDPLRSRDDFKRQMARLAEIGKGAEWLTDLETAKRQAVAQGKDLFVYFSGSDWCPWCLLFRRTILDKPAFARYAARNFVLVQMDDPHRSAPPANAAIRIPLERRWQVYAIPKVILADSRGRAYAEVPYGGGQEEPVKYTEKLDRLRQERAARDEALSRAAAAQGVERAQHLDQALGALKALPQPVMIVDYAELISHFLNADPEDRSGLRSKYVHYVNRAWGARHREVEEALKRGDWQEAIDECDAILSGHKPGGRAEQETRVSRALALKGLGRKAEAEDEFTRAIDMARKDVEGRRAAFEAAPSDDARRKDLSTSYQRLIAALQKSGRSTEAIATARLRRELWPENPTELYNAACELALSVPAPAAGGKGEQAPAATDLDAGRQQVADDAMETLRRSVLAGFVDTGWMNRDPDLEILRARPDFRALVRSLRELGGPATPVSELRRLAGHGPNTRPLVTVSPDGRHLVSAGPDQTLRYWDLEAGRELRRVETAGKVLALALSPDGRRALTGGANKIIQLWDVESGKEVWRIASGENVLALAFAPDGRRGLAGLADATLRLLDLEAGREVRRLQGHTARAVRAVTFAPGGLRAVSGGDDGTVRIWDVETGRELRRLEGPRAMVWSLAFAPNGGRVLAGCDDGLLFAWDASDGREVCRMESPSGAVLAAAFSPDGRRVISVHGSGRLIVRDLGDGREVLRLHGVGGQPTLAVLPDGRRAAVGDAGGMIRIWSLDEELVRPRELDLLGRWAEAGAALEGAIRLRPDEPRLWVLRGRHEMLLGRWGEAAAGFRKAIELGRDDPDLLSVVAGVLQVDPPGPGEGARRLLDSLDPRGPHAVTLWMKLTRPGLGIDLSPTKDGIRLMSLDPRGGAAKAGLQVDDVVFEVAGKPVVDQEGLRAVLKDRRPGDPVVVNVRRGTSSLTRAVTLASVPILNQVRQGRSREGLVAEHRRLLDAGYRPAYITVSPHGGRRPTYAGLWLRDERPFLDLLEDTAEAFEKQARERPAEYRLEWLHIAGEADRRQWTAVWVADPGRLPGEFQVDLGRSQLSAMIDERAGRGYRPTLITAYRGPGEETRYAGVWIKEATPSQVRVHITAEELQRQLDNLSSDWRPEWVDAYTEQGRRFYTALFVKDDGRAEWQLTIDTPEWGMQSLLKKMTEEGFAPVLLDLE